MRQCADQLRSNTTTINFLANPALRRFLSAAHHAVMVSGIAALCTLAAMYFRPDFGQKLKGISHVGASAAPATIVQVPATVVPMDTPKTHAESHDVEGSDPFYNDAVTPFNRAKVAGSEREQRWVTTWLSKRYRVANDATDMLVSAAYSTAKDTRIDPLLILAVVAIESGFNPFAESAVGAQGLMQVMSKVHKEKFQQLGGVKAALNPVANIRVGSMILKDYVSRGGSIEAGLKMYVGAAAFDNDAGYGSKVLAEYRRLKDVSMGKNVPLFVTPPQAVVVHNQTKATDTDVTLPKANTADIEGDKNLVPEAARESTSVDRFAIM